MPYHDPAMRKRYNAAWRTRNKDKVRGYFLRQTYGLTVQQHAEMLARGCGICGTMKNLEVDHDHLTGKVRGALCSKHNVGLGQFNDDPDVLRRAIRWLEETS